MWPNLKINGFDWFGLGLMQTQKLSNPNCLDWFESIRVRGWPAMAYTPITKKTNKQTKIQKKLFIGVYLLNIVLSFFKSFVYMLGSPTSPALVLGV